MVPILKPLLGAAARNADDTELVSPDSTEAASAASSSFWYSCVALPAARQFSLRFHGLSKPSLIW